MVRSRVLAYMTGITGNAAVPVFVCPPGRTAIVKQWAMHMTTGNPAGANVLVRRGTQSVKLAAYSGPPGAPFLSPAVEVVLEPGDELLVQCVLATDVVRFFASGSLLVGVST